MIKRIVFVLVCLVAYGAQGQDGTISPYSYFGLGETSPASTVENQMMGSIGVFADSVHVNLKNPAAYSKLGVRYGEDFGITTYTAGISHKQTQLKSFSDQESSNLTTLDYLSLGFSLRKGLGIGVGIMPYTSVGYSFVEQMGTEGSRTINEYSGDGGLNKIYFSVGYELMKDLSVGVTANYNFGTIESLRLQSLENVQFGVKDERTSRIDGFDLNYAVYYTPAIDKKHTLYTSLRINTQANLSARNTQRLGSFSLLTQADIEVYDVDLESRGLKETGVKVPTTSTIGLGYGENMKWFLGAEYSFQQLGDYSNVFNEIENLEYSNASTFALGGFFIPNRSSFESYLKRITYRAGMRFEQTGMMVNEKEVNNFGINFGVGLPLGNNMSNLNIGFELGRRGTTSADLIEESYFKINVGLSLNDVWFLQRKIN